MQQQQAGRAAGHVHVIPAPVTDLMIFANAASTLRSDAVTNAEWPRVTHAPFPAMAAVDKDLLNSVTVTCNLIKGKGFRVQPHGTKKGEAAGAGADGRGRRGSSGAGGQNACCL